MKIAIVTDYFLPRLGGIEVHIHDLVRMLQDAGHSVTVLTTTPGAEYVEDVTVRPLRGLLAPGYGFSVSPSPGRRLRRNFSRGFDVVHIHLSVVSPLGWSAIFAAKRRGIPAVATFHSVFGKAVPAFRIANRLLGWSNGPLLLSAVSELVAGQIRQVAPGKPVTILPNGVRAEDWRTEGAAKHRNPDEIVAVSAMRLNPIKRPVALLEAFRRAREKTRPHARRLVLKIAGAGPERAKMERYIANHALADDVTLLGPMSRDALRALYADADMFLLPSIEEAFGIAALEARCAGLPVIAMKNAGPESFVRHEETGLLADDDAAFAGHMARLALDDALRSRLAPPDPGLDRYAWPRVRDDNIACYERAMALVARPAPAAR